MKKMPLQAMLRRPLAASATSRSGRWGREAAAQEWAMAKVRQKKTMVQMGPKAQSGGFQAGLRSAWY